MNFPSLVLGVMAYSEVLEEVGGVICSSGCRRIHRKDRRRCSTFVYCCETGDVFLCKGCGCADSFDVRDGESVFYLPKGGNKIKTDSFSLL